MSALGQHSADATLSATDVDYGCVRRELVAVRKQLQ
jgi:hypothetical protein